VLEASANASSANSTATSAGSTGTQTGSSADSSATSTIYNLLSEKGKILLGKQHNSIIVIDYPTNMAKVEEYLKEIDKKMASRVFKLKYLKASDVVGEKTSAASSATNATTSTTSSDYNTTSASGTGTSVKGN
jgi:hypothetical protein